MLISWKHDDATFHGALTFDQKIEVFYERIWGWQLHVAEICLNGGRSHDGRDTAEAIPHSAFAAMQIMLSYFEMIAKYEDGFVPKTPKQGESPKYFKRGVQSVFPALESQQPHV